MPNLCVLCHAIAGVKTLLQSENGENSPRPVIPASRE
jgi:hypothetical protein